MYHYPDARTRSADSPLWSTSCRIRGYCHPSPHPSSCSDPLKQHFFARGNYKSIKQKTSFLLLTSVIFSKVFLTSYCWRWMKLKEYITHVRQYKNLYALKVPYKRALQKLWSSFEAPFLRLLSWGWALISMHLFGSTCILGCVHIFSDRGRYAVLNSIAVKVFKGCFGLYLPQSFCIFIKLLKLSLRQILWINSPTHPPDAHKRISDLKPDRPCK